jgi:hypothetical protein
MSDVRERVANRLVEVVEEAARKLRAVSDKRAEARPSPGKWCAKEILGHLLDSAANNQQRFVRAQLADELSLPGYEQDRWVSVQGYAAARWADLAELWRLENLRLAEVIRLIDAGKLSTPCRIGSHEPVTLGWIVEDYLRHVEHHLKQLHAALT